MIYVTSDLHGLEITKLKALLKKACFNENDRLFVLGDVIDRQNDGGVAILIWLTECTADFRKSRSDAFIL